MGSKHEMVAGVAQVIGTNESGEGICTTSYELRTTRRSVQGSWAVEGVVEQQVRFRTIMCESSKPRRLMCPFIFAFSIAFESLCDLQQASQDMYQSMTVNSLLSLRRMRMRA